MSHFLTGRASVPLGSQSDALSDDSSHLAILPELWTEEDALGTRDRLPANRLAPILPAPARQDSDTDDEYRLRIAKEAWTLTHLLGVIKNRERMVDMSDICNMAFLHPVVYDALNQNLSLVIMPTLGTTLSLKKWLDSANLEWDRAVELNPDAERNLFKQVPEVYSFPAFEFMATKLDPVAGALLHLCVTTPEIVPPVSVWYLWADGYYHFQQEAPGLTTNVPIMPPFTIPPVATRTRPKSQHEDRLNVLLIVLKTSTALGRLRAEGVAFPAHLAARARRIVELDNAIRYRPSKASIPICPYQTIGRPREVITAPVFICSDGQPAVYPLDGQLVGDLSNVSVVVEEEGSSPEQWEVAEYYDDPSPTQAVHDPDPVYFQGALLPPLQRVPARNSLTVQRGFVVPDQDNVENGNGVHENDSEKAES